MEIVDFTSAHIEQAERIALLNYNAERANAQALPLLESIPDISYFADNNLGVAAFEGDEMLGYLCSVPPFENAFGSAGVTGVFSPMGAHGAACDNRAKVYALMYQAAGEKWLKAGASSHAVCLYAHDKKLHEQFFHYGFGLRCVDAIRLIDESLIKKPQKNAKAKAQKKPEPSKKKAESLHEYSFSELTADGIQEVFPLDQLLNEHYSASPTFMQRTPDSIKEFMEKIEQNRSIFFAAKFNGKTIAYIRAEQDGETFIKNTPGYLHINGAFCLQEYRGKGIQERLLNMLTEKLKSLEYSRLGVDFESTNPAAWGFWLKHFTAYTYSVVRSID